MRRLLLTTAIASVCLPAAAAQGATTYVVNGAGYGHGIGMSQYGAQGFAQHGWGYARILSHYYTGTELGKAPSRPVRVLLQENDPYVRFQGASTASGTALDPSTTYVVRSSRGRLTLQGGGRRLGSFDAPLRVSNGGKPLRLLGVAINGISSDLYRGSFELHPGSGGGVTAVNAVPIDDYVQGVVSGEMPSSWDYDALRVQAVAARTYALTTRKTSGIFDQYPDIRSQTYRGVNSETARTNTAVRQTAGEIVTYQGAPAVTFYFSTSGGRTESIENSFVGAPPKPWLKSVEDPYDDIAPLHRWNLRFSAATLDARLGAPGTLRNVKVLQRGESPRIVRARVIGSAGSRTLTGPQIRALLGLNDTWAYFTKVGTRQARSSARAAGTGRTALRIAGSFEPAPRSRELALERRGSDGWKRVGGVRTTARGRFGATVATAGVYRVRSGRTAGSAVRVR